MASRYPLRYSTAKQSERREKLEYMQSMIRELRDLSAPQKCDMVTYFLELAYIETCDVIRTIHAESSNVDVAPGKGIEIAGQPADDNSDP